MVSSTTARMHARGDPIPSLSMISDYSYFDNAILSILRALRNSNDHDAFTLDDLYTFHITDPSLDSDCRSSIAEMPVYVRTYHGLKYIVDFLSIRTANLLEQFSSEYNRVLTSCDPMTTFGQPYADLTHKLCSAPNCDRPLIIDQMHALNMQTYAKSITIGQRAMEFVNAFRDILYAEIVLIDKVTSQLSRKIFENLDKGPNSESPSDEQVSEIQEGICACRIKLVSELSAANCSIIYMAREIIMATQTLKNVRAKHSYKYRLHNSKSISS